MGHRDALWRIVLASAAVLFASGIRAQEGDTYAGIGFSHASIRSEYSAIGSKQAGGVALFLGSSLTETISGELYASFGHNIATDATANISFPPDSAAYGVTTISLRFSPWPIARRQWAPWLAVGVGVGDVYWDTYYYRVTGFGPAVSAGADVLIPDSRWMVRVQFMQHRFSADDNYGFGPYRVTGRVLSAGVLYRF